MDREKISDEEQNEFEDMLKKHQEEWSKLWKKELENGKRLLWISALANIFVMLSIINSILKNKWFGVLFMVFILIVNIISAKNLYKNYKIIQKKYFKK